MREWPDFLAGLGLDLLKGFLVRIESDVPPVLREVLDRPRRPVWLGIIRIAKYFKSFAVMVCKHRLNKVRNGMDCKILGQVAYTQSRSCHMHWIARPTWQIGFRMDDRMVRV